MLAGHCPSLSIADPVLESMFRASRSRSSSCTEGSASHSDVILGLGEYLDCTRARESTPESDFEQEDNDIDEAIGHSYPAFMKMGLGPSKKFMGTTPPAAPAQVVGSDIETLAFEFRLEKMKAELQRQMDDDIMHALSTAAADSSDPTEDDSPHGSGKRRTVKAMANNNEPGQSHLPNGKHGRTIDVADCEDLPSMLDRQSGRKRRRTAKALANDELAQDQDAAEEVPPSSVIADQPIALSHKPHHWPRVLLRYTRSTGRSLSISTGSRSNSPVDT